MTCVFDLEGYGALETVMPPFQARLPRCAMDASALHPDALASTTPDVYDVVTTAIVPG